MRAIFLLLFTTIVRRGGRYLTTSVSASSQGGETFSVLLYCEFPRGGGHLKRGRHLSCCLRYSASPRRVRFARGRHDKAALHWALTAGTNNYENGGPRALAPERRLEVVKRLVARGAAVEARDMDDSTPLLAGVEWGGVWQVHGMEVPN